MYGVLAVVTALVIGVGAAIWSRTMADDDGIETVQLSVPGEYGDPALINTDRVGAGLADLGDLTVQTVDGDTVALEPDGRAMVVNVWHTRCPPCSRELAYFDDISRDYADRVRFVGVDPYDDADEMLEFAAARGVGYELYLDDGYAVFDALQIVSFPLTLLVTADGMIVAQTAEVSEAEMRQLVAELAANTAPVGDSTPTGR